MSSCPIQPMGANRQIIFPNRRIPVSAVTSSITPCWGKAAPVRSRNLTKGTRHFICVNETPKSIVSMKSSKSVPAKSTSQSGEFVHSFLFMLLMFVAPVKKSYSAELHPPKPHRCHYASRYSEFLWYNQQSNCEIDRIEPSVLKNRMGSTGKFGRP